MRIDEKQMECALAGVRKLMADGLRNTSMASITDEIVAVIGNGKMLRGRLMFRVGAVTDASVDTLTRSAAAIELLHTASLLHDDVIDGAVLRRSVPAFWVTKGASGAVLLGDLLMCQAFKLVNEAEVNKRLISVLIDQISEMCEAETEQELILKGQIPDWPTCVSIARRKTGSLFAFAGFVAGGIDDRLCDALKDASYSAGTAYQLADDLFDAYGNPDQAGKSLGNDAIAGKITAASSWRLSNVEPQAYIEQLLRDSEEKLQPWPAVAGAWRDYLKTDLATVIEAFLKSFSAQTV